MMVDTAAETELAQVIEQWTAGGVLPVLRELVGRVWRDDVDRHEPALGDDSISLGVQSSRNICNLAVRRLTGMPGVRARDYRTLEVTYAGRTLHTGKAPSDSPLWAVHSVVWGDSVVRDEAAAANSGAYQPLAGTLFESLGPVAGQGVDAGALTYLHLTWQGLPDGGIRTWLGFPRLGEFPWFAVTIMDDESGLSALPAPARGAGPEAPDHRSLSEPDVRPTLRPVPAPEFTEPADGSTGRSDR
jgi:hypothetical protein